MITGIPISRTEALAGGSVAIVVNTYNQARYLAEALESCMRQTFPPAELLLVDDGSHDDVECIARRFPMVRLHRQENAGLSAARNAGLARISSEFVVFLDADDRLTPMAVEAGLNCFEKNLDAWLVYGAYRIVDEAGRPVSPPLHEEVGLEPFYALLKRGNLIAMHATAMYRSDRLRSIACFDSRLKMCEDYDAYLRIARRGRISTHDYCVAEYRHHQMNMSRDNQKMLETGLSVISFHAEQDGSPQAATAARCGRKTLTRHYAPEIVIAAARSLISKRSSVEAVNIMFRAAIRAPLTTLRTVGSRGLRSIVGKLPRVIGRRFGVLWVPEVGTVRFGDLGRTKPISLEFGFDRGKPIDRYYIERALGDNSVLIRGRVLEVKGRDYTRSFGGSNVERSDVLDVDATNPLATIIGDLGVTGALPEGMFDCIVLTQTLQLIFNLDNAIENLYRALAPGGALLITAPGISPIGRSEIPYWSWAFTPFSLKSLLRKRFSESNVQVQSYGNVFAAISFLTGLSLAETGTEKLQYRDESYPVTIFACAQKEALSGWKPNAEDTESGS